MWFGSGQTTFSRLLSGLVLTFNLIFSIPAQRPGQVSSQQGLRSVVSRRITIFNLHKLCSFCVILQQHSIKHVIMKSLTTTVLSIFLCFTTYATAQFPDKIIFNGKSTAFIPTHWKLTLKKVPANDQKEALCQQHFGGAMLQLLK